jgi:hypothetical protein
VTAAAKAILAAIKINLQNITVSIKALEHDELTRFFCPRGWDRLARDAGTVEAPGPHGQATLGPTDRRLDPDRHRLFVGAPSFSE